MNTLKRRTVAAGERADILHSYLIHPGRRLGLITSVDGTQLVTLVLDIVAREIELWETPLCDSTYPSATFLSPQAHWMERTTWDLFGLYPVGHPRLKHTLLHEAFKEDFFPLLPDSLELTASRNRSYEPMTVAGDGVLELPVGPIHAGIIEPGHFRFSCLGEIIFNLEIRLGYLHRGVEKRLTELPLRHQRFVAEAAASDAAAAYALAHAEAIENLCSIQPPEHAQRLRTVALEIERAGMHLADLGGLAGDLGFQAVSVTLASLRGDCLKMAELLCGSRFLKSFICPGGVTVNSSAAFSEIQKIAVALSSDLEGPLTNLLANQVALDRMEKIGRVSDQLAMSFGFTGVTGRASGVCYDVRQCFKHGLYPELSLPVFWDAAGDILARTKIRINELFASLTIINEVLGRGSSGKVRTELPDDRELPAESASVGIVESHRGELIHLVITDRTGRIVRYAIKDPSVNNWTALAIASRNNLLSDFPLCNKSFALSYGGHDL